MKKGNVTVFDRFLAYVKLRRAHYTHGESLHILKAIDKKMEFWGKGKGDKG
jgi:hypothetical protein